MNNREINILVVDDESRAGKLLCEILEDNGFKAEFFANSADALSRISRKKTPPIDILLTDLKMPGMDGIELLGRVKRIAPNIQIILMTAYATVETAVEAMKLGASDYIIKPFDESKIIEILNKIIDTYFCKSDEVSCKLHAQGLGNLIGDTPVMHRLFESIQKVAPSDAPVLITGESGTGKEVVARTIHEYSSRQKFPFVAINCAAINENLLESELFGYEKGAFTGADRKKIGLFETAEKGTLFLDEIAEMPYLLQSKLLRVLQEKKVVHLGGLKPIDINVRILAATNRNPQEMIQNNEFREDLFYRLSVFPIQIPPLRDRLNDIPLLLRHILTKKNIQISDISLENISNKLMSFNWKGNIRELENVIERAIILSGRDEITPEYFKISIIESSDNNLKLKNLDEIEKDMLIKALKESGGNKTRAAEILGISRRMIYSRIEKYGISN